VALAMITSRHAAARAHVALAALAILAPAACGGDDGDGDGAPDDAALTDARDGGDRHDAADLDAPPADAAPIDARPVDARPIDATPDAPARTDNHIHISVSNTCVMAVSPTSITIPPDQTAYFDWHNHSVDYPVTVWMRYGGGFTDLPTGATWDEPVSHCATPLVHDEYADISTACASVRFVIHCQ